MGAPKNPFSTRYVRPGTIPFLGMNPERTKQLATAFAATPYGIGQIVGPHGTGKTTLTYTIEPYLRETFSMVRRMTIREPHSFSTPSFANWNICFHDRHNPKTQLQNISQPEFFNRTDLRFSRTIERKLLIVDGLERLTIMHRIGLIAACKRNKIGLLVTTHRPIAFVPRIATLTPDLDTFREVVEHLMESDCLNGKIESCFRQADQNYREALMLMYDEFEKLEPHQQPTNKSISCSSIPTPTN